MPLIPLDEPTTKRIPPDTFSLFALGFRPLYLLGAAFAAIAIPAWVMVFVGVLQSPIPGIWWHAHEMLFGFGVAIIVGFLFTAGKAWTGLQTPTEGPLAAVAALWLAGRLAMAFGGGGVLASAIDVAFLPLCAAIFFRVLLKAGSTRNYFIGLLLSMLGLVNLVFHLALHGALALDPLATLLFALGLVVVLESIVAGRVVPMFTANAVRGVRQWRNKTLDYAAVIAGGLALLLWAIGVGGAAGALSLLAAVLHLVRIGGWNPWATRKNPLLWILHLAYLWIPIGLILIGLGQFGLLPRSAGVHALAIGSMGGLIIGMITRTALGHTGRMLVAGPVETIAYVLVLAAALVRVLTVTAIPAATMAGIHFAATAWSLAFLLYVWRYLPFLTRARVDGKAG